MVSPERFRPDQSWSSGPVGPVGSGPEERWNTSDYFSPLTPADTAGHPVDCL